MRRAAWLAGLVLLWGWLAVAPALAATIPFQATLAIDGQNLAVAVGGSGVATLDRVGSVAIDGITVPMGAASGASSVVQTSPAFLPDFGALSIDGGNGAGVFARTGQGALSGTMPLFGVLRICTFLECDDSPGFLPLLPGVIGVPGASGATTTNVLGLRVTVSGAAWTTGRVTVTTTTPARQTLTDRRTGFAHGPASNTGSVAQSGGVIQLVTPIVVQSFGINTPKFGMFGTLTLTFVPEPTRGLLLGAAAAAGGVLGWRRRARPGDAARPKP